MTGGQRKIRIMPTRAAVSTMILLFLITLSSAQTFTVLHAFTGKGDGSFPESGVILDAKGDIYGATESGGALDKGAIYKIDARGKETILHTFWGGDGLGPDSLIRDHEGNLYGAAADGGTPEGGKCLFGCGAIFKVDKSGKETVLYAFTGGTDGWDPFGPLVSDRSGSVDGTAEFGGNARCQAIGCGVVFRVGEDGKETVLHSFNGVPDGTEPSYGVIQDEQGNLYGTTAQGGDPTKCDGAGCGVVFKVTHSGKETLLYSFTGGADGGGPSGPLLRDADGNLYGVTAYGGDLSVCQTGRFFNGCGVLFRLDTSGKEIALYDFRGGPVGRTPQGGLVRDSNGAFYGVTFSGGSDGCGDHSGCGVVFKVDANGNETVLHTFTGGSDGAWPNGNLIMDAAGNLYGTTAAGGDPSCGYGDGCGVVFRISP